eukprot:m.192554 g.192554  ORF g.192554 m.192554 type:complete len:1442 (-) comp16964_c0_seq1:1864-6189(-)
MGVQSLWQLLEATARPVDFEQLEGQVLAVDISIWLHQIVRAMRDRRGELVENAHIHAMLTRVCKLLYHQIKPVFVFDGGAPAIKQQAVVERRKRITTGSDELRKAQTKLLQNEMRRQILGVPESTPGTRQRMLRSMSAHARDDMYKLPALPKDNILERDDDDDDESEDLDMLLEDEEEVYDPMKEAARMSSDSDGTVQSLRPKLVKRRKRRAPSGPASSSTGPNAKQPSRSSKGQRKPVLTTQYDELMAASLAYEEEGGYPESFPSATEPTAQSTAVQPTATQSTPAQPKPSIMIEASDTGIQASHSPQNRSKRYRAGTKYTLDASTIDLFTPEFDALPLEIQYEIVMERRELNKNKSKRKAKVDVNGTSDTFSTGQLHRVLQRDRINKKLEDIRQALLKEESLYGLTVQKVVSEENTVFILSERTDDVMPLPDTPERSPLVKGPRALRHQVERIAEPLPLPAETKSQPTAQDELQTNSQPDAGLDVRQQLLSNVGASTQDLDSDASLSFASDDENTGDEASVGNEPPTPVSESQSTTRPSPVLKQALPACLETEETIQRAKLSQSSSRLFLSTLQTQAAVFDRNSSIASIKTEGGDAWELPLQARIAQPATRQLKGPPKLSAVTTLSSDSDDSDEEEFVVPLAKKHSMPAEKSQRTAKLAKSMNKLRRSTSDEITKPISTSPKPSSLDKPGADQLTMSVSDEPPTLLAASTVDSALSLLQEANQSSDTPSALNTRQKDQFDVPELPETMQSEPEVVSPSSPEKVLIATKVRDVALVASPKQSASKQAASEPMKRHKSVEVLPGVTLDDALASNETREAAQAELDKEHVLLSNNARRAARAAGDVTADMITEVQHLLMLFGCPYIVAPQEAESQCAQLEQLGLVDGTITDDNDVLLFGGRKVYRHMCSRSKSPTLYVAEDIDQVLGLDRTKLISLAYFLGSDYNEGIKGVGPVMSMELLAEFPGGLEDLRKFRTWFQSIKDPAAVTPETSVLRAQLQKRMHGKVVLPKGFPNPLVYKGYMEPVVDKDDETFEWGKIDVEGLRDLVRVKLGWEAKRADDHVLPVIRQANEKKAQRKINSYFMQAPRRRSRGKGQEKLPNDDPLAPDEVDDHLLFATDRLKNAVRSVKGKARRSPAKRKQPATARKKAVPTAFTLYSKHVRPDLKKQDPNATAKELTSRISLLWRGLTEEAKQPWVTQHETLRAAALAEEERERLVGLNEDELLVLAAEDAEAQERKAKTKTPTPKKPKHQVKDADGFFASLPISDVPSDFITINRGPVLVLWVAVVLKAGGYRWSEGLSLGRGLANVFAHSKGRSLGMLGEADEDLSGFPTASFVDVLGRRLPVVKEDGQLVCISDGRRVNPLNVLTQLRSKFKDALGGVTAAFQQLAASVPNPIQLQAEGYELYTKFRPAVAYGRAGWGQSGQLNLGEVRALARTYLEQQA